MKDFDILGIHVFHFNNGQNGGESFCFTTKFLYDGSRMFSCDPVKIEHTISLQSHSNEVSIDLNSIQITPTMLRKLADELEFAEKEAKNQAGK